MALIAWRKLQAGYSGAEGSADPGLVATHTEQVGSEGGSFLAGQLIKKLKVSWELQIPIGTDMYPGGH